MKRTAAGAMALALLLAACGSDGDDDSSGSGGSGAAPAADAVKIEVGAVPTADHAPLYVAKELGLFAEHGLDVTVSNVTPGAGVLLAALDAGDVDVLEQVPTFAGLGAEQGNDVQFFCGSWPVINSALVVKADSELQTAEEAGGWEAAVSALKGKTIGVAVTGSTIHYWAQSVLEAAGLSADDADYVQVGTGPAALPVLEQGRVDAILTYPWMTEQILSSGDGKVLTQFNVDGPTDFASQMQNGWVAKASWLKENPEAAESFCNAIGEANEKLADPAAKDEMAALLEGAFGLDDDGVIDLLLEDGGSLSQLDTEMSCDGLEKAIEFGVDFGQLTGDADYSCDALIWEGAPKK